MRASIHPKSKTPRHSLNAIDPSNFVGIKFAIPQGSDPFGSLRPPKWGHILSYHLGTWTISCEDHIRVVEDEDVFSPQKKSSMMTLNDEEFDKLRYRAKIDTLVPEFRKSDDDLMDFNVVTKQRRRFVNLKFTIPVDTNYFPKVETDGTLTNFHFLKITDYMAVRSKTDSSTKDIWIVMDEMNNQHFMFYSDLMQLISQKASYDVKSNEVTSQTVCRYIVEYPYFDPFILFVIFVNCITLIIEKEYDECDEDLNYKCEEKHEDLWYDLNIVFTSIFFVEMALKMKAYGLLNDSHPVGYFNDAWNYLDFAVVVEGFMSIFMSGGFGISGIRALRILRPLRAITRFPKLKNIVDAFIKSIPLLVDTLTICFFFFLVFAICAVQVFLGTFRTRCFDNETGTLVEDIEFACGGGFTCPSGSYCGADVVNPNRGVTSFDNFFVSFLTIFQAITLEGWVDIMYWGMDSVSVWTWIFYIVLIIIGAFVLINLALAIILSKFNEGRAEILKENSRKNRKLIHEMILRMRDAERMARGQDDDEDEESKSSKVCNDDDDENNTINSDDKDETSLSGFMKCLKMHHPAIRKICVATWFDILMCLIIVGNMIAIAVDHYPQSKTFEDNLEVSNFVFTMIFVAEMIFKWFGLGLWDYFADGMNVLDFVIVVVGVIEISLVGSSSFTAFRALRFGRLVKFIKFMKSFQEILRVLASSLEGIFYVSMLLLLFMVIFSILGMQFFQHKLFDDEGNVPRNNFDSFHWAFVSIFQVLAGENWPALLYDGIAGTTWLTGSIFFVSWVIIGQFVLLNLFLAVIMANFDDMLEDNEDDDTEKIHDSSSTTTATKENEEIKVDDVDKDGKSFKETKSSTKTLQDITKRKFDESNEKKLQKLRTERNLHLQDGTNLFYIKRGDSFHVFNLDLALNSRFNNTILVLIMFSSLVLAMECPATQDPDHENSKYDDDTDDIWGTAFLILEIIFTTAFTIEAIVKCIAFGFVMHPNSYLRSGWNVLDFIVVIAAILDLTLNLEAVSVLRILRLIRVLRPLRVVKNNPGLKRVINAFILSLESLKDIFLVLVFAWILFSMLGVTLFKGRLYTCSDGEYPADTSRYGVCALDPVDNVTCLTTAGGNMVYTTPPCDNSISTYYAYPSLALTNNTDSSGAQREWIRVMDMNFDNVYEGFLVLFVSASGEGWPDVMFATSDITDIDRTPKLNNSPINAYYWITYITIVCFFIVELFVGALFTKFAEMKRRDDVAHLFLTEEQELWVKQQKRLMQSKPTKPKAMVYLFPEYVEERYYRKILQNKVPRHSMKARTVLYMNSLRNRCFGLVMSPAFETFIFFCIFANTIVIAMPYYEMKDSYIDFLYIGNLIFTIVFIVEMVLKHYALSFAGYWSDNWNTFDGILVLFSLLDILFSNIFPASVFRVLRIGRVFGKLAKIGRVGRIGKALSGVIKILGTLYLTIPAIANVGSLVLLFFFIFAVLGVNLYGKLELEAPHSSFQDFPNAMLTLFRVATGEDWQNLMYACYEGEYGKYPAALYFLFFVFGSAFVTLNIFVAIIAENFEEDPVEDIENEGDNEDDDSDKDKIILLGVADGNELITHETKDLVKRFKTAWAIEDPSGSHFIPTSRLRHLLVGIGVPGGIPESATESDFENYLLRLDIASVTSRSEFLNYHDVLVSMHRTLFKNIADTIPHELHSELEIDKDQVRTKILENTKKRSKKSGRLGRRSSKQLLLRRISATLAEQDKDTKDGPTKMLHTLQKSISFNILIRRVQRRWRARRRISSTN